MYYDSYHGNEDSSTETSPVAFPYSDSVRE